MFTVRTPNLAEIVEEIVSAEDKKEVAQRYASRKDLQFIVDLMYNYDLSGIILPKFKAYEHNHHAYSNILKNIKRIQSALYHREAAHIYERNMAMTLESLAKNECQLLTSILKGNKIKGINKSTWQAIFPDLF